MLILLSFLLIAGSVLLFFARYIRYWWLLAKLPCAKGIPFLGHLVTFFPGKEVILQSIDNIIKEPLNQAKLRKYGILSAWSGPVPFILIHNLEDIELILCNSTLTYKGYQYSFFKDWLGTGLLTSEGSHHQKHRKVITPAFHFKILEKFVPIFNSNIKTFLNLMDEKVVKGSFDVEPYLSNLTLDIIAETSLGTKLHMQTQYSPYPKAIEVITNAAVDRGCRPLIFSDFMFNLSPLGRKQKEAVKIVNDITVKLIKKRREEKRNEITTNNNIMSETEIGLKEKEAFLDVLLEIEKTSPDFTDKNIQDEVNTVMFGGHDTIVSAAAFMFHALGKNPRIQEEIFKEIETVIGDDELTFNNLQELKYLERGIKESLRQYPPIPIIFRDAAKDIRLKSGYILPVGSPMVLFYYYLHNDPLLYPNPEVFDPDRFLPENCAERHPFSYLPFSAGPRNCIGQKMGMLELKAIVAYTVRRFKIKSTHDVKPMFSVTLQSSNGIQIALERREKLSTTTS